MSAPEHRAIFMDRDGTLCEEVGYVNHVSRSRLLPRSIDALRRVNEAGFLGVLATNQAGVARGYFEEPLVHEVHAHLREMLAAGGAHLDAIYVCLHHPTAGEPPYRADCDCRKPRPGMLQRAAREMGIALEKSYMIGDSIKDVEAAARAGATGVLVLTGYGLGEWTYRRDRWSVQPAHVAADLLDAVEWILGREERAS